MSTQTTPPLSPEAKQALTQAGLLKIYTNPLSSKVVQVVVTMLISFLGTKFGFGELEKGQVEDIVEVVIIVLAGLGVIYFRWRSDHTIMSVQAAAQMFHDNLAGLADRALRRDVLTHLAKTNPKVHDIVQEMLFTADPEPDEPTVVLSPAEKNAAEELADAQDTFGNSAMQAADAARAKDFAKLITETTTERQGPLHAAMGLMSEDFQAKVRQELAILRQPPMAG